MIRRFSGETEGWVKKDVFIFRNWNDNSWHLNTDISRMHSLIKIHSFNFLTANLVSWKIILGRHLSSHKKDFFLLTRPLISCLVKFILIFSFLKNSAIENISVRSEALVMYDKRCLPFKILLLNRSLQQNRKFSPCQTNL